MSRSWNLTIEDEAGNRIPPGLAMLASARPDSQPDQLCPVAVKADPVNPGRAALTWDNAPVFLGAYTITLYVQGYAPIEFRCDLPDPGSHETHGVPPHPGIDPSPIPKAQPSAIPFPPGAKRAPLGPKEPDDPGFGNVYYDLPPEWFTQPGTTPVAPNIDLIRGSAFTYLTDWAVTKADGSVDYDFLRSIGQNTNYDGRMWYTPLLNLYPQRWQDTFLSDYGTWFTHLLLTTNAEQGGTIDSVASVASRWRVPGHRFAFAFSMDQAEIDGLAAREAVDGIVIGLEANKWPDTTVDALCRATAADCVPKGIRVWVHFLSTGGPHNKQQWGIFDYKSWWAEMAAIGISGLLYETYMTYEPDPAYTVDMGADPNHLGDSAGKMGAMAGYPRRGLYQANPALKFCHCETWSAPPFYGHTDALFASRRNYELCCAPSDGVMNPVSGYFNDARLPDGSVF